MIQKSSNADLAQDAIEWLNEIRCWINRCKDTEWGEDDQAIVDFITAALSAPHIQEHTSVESVAMEDAWLREKISRALGEASMCWSEIPTGVFHSERATQILNDLCCQINVHKSAPKMKRVDLDEMKQNTTSKDAHRIYGYNAAIDDIKSKYGDLYIMEGNKK